MAQGKTDNLEAFARRIITRLNKSAGNTDQMERLICRMMMGENEKVASFMANKVVEWRYGKPMQGIQLTEAKPMDLGFNESASDQPSRVC